MSGMQHSIFLRSKAPARCGHRAPQCPEPQAKNGRGGRRHNTASAAPAAYRAVGNAQIDNLEAEDVLGAVRVLQSVQSLGPRTQEDLATKSVDPFHPPAPAVDDCGLKSHVRAAIAGGHAVGEV